MRARPETSPHSVRMTNVRFSEYQVREGMWDPWHPIWHKSRYFIIGDSSLNYPFQVSHLKAVRTKMRRMKVYIPNCNVENSCLIHNLLCIKAETILSKTRRLMVHKQMESGKGFCLLSLLITLFHNPITRTALKVISLLIFLKFEHFPYDVLAVCELWFTTTSYI